MGIASLAKLYCAQPMLVRFQANGRDAKSEAFEKQLQILFAPQNPLPSSDALRVLLDRFIPYQKPKRPQFFRLDFSTEAEDRMKRLVYVFLDFLRTQDTQKKFLPALNEATRQIGAVFGRYPQPDHRIGLLNMVAQEINDTIGYQLQMNDPKAYR